MNPRVLALIAVIVIVFVLLGALLYSGISSKHDPDVQKYSKPVTINYWRVFDGKDSFSDIISQYSALHPNITIKYRKLRFSEYEQALLEAFAVDKGPDILSIHNTWMKRFYDKGWLSPMPDQTKTVFMVPGGGLKKEPIPELRTKNSITPKELKSQFVDVVAGDAIIREKVKGKVKDSIYGLPMYVDTLVLFYNNDLLNNAGIIFPPEYWDKKFQQDVKKLTKQDSRGNIIQAGVALGGSENIERASDILSVLMMQNGAVMMSGNNVRFHTIPSEFEKKRYNPGMEALRFYSDFANPGKEVYSWNNEMKNALDLFIDGKLAYMFGYAYHIPFIKAGNPKLNFKITALPQIEGNNKVNYANYWLETVAKKSKYKNEAWDFIQFATKKRQAKTFLERAKRPTALKSLIEEQKESTAMEVFADQVLTAKSWYKGDNAAAADKAIGEMIDKTVAGKGKLEDIINSAANKVQQTVNTKD